MNPLWLVIGDSAIMLRRQIKHMQRYPIVLFMVGIPVIMLLLFVYVFGGTLGAGIGGVEGGREVYLRYVVPGILLMTVAMSAQLTPISVAMDMTEGIIARFRTMAVSRTAVLAGHVAASLMQTVLALVLVIGAAVLIGFRPTTDPVRWLAMAGLLAVITLAFTWLSVAFGLVTKSVEAASNVGMPLMLLPFLGSGFVPTESLPAGMRWFAEHQPFTPMIEALRGLMLAEPLGNSVSVSIAWCGVIGLAGYLLARWLYERRSV